MEFHEIDTVGRIWIQRLATLPTWHASYSGRLIYITSEGKVYFGEQTDWVEISADRGSGGSGNFANLGDGGVWLSGGPTNEFAANLFPVDDMTYQLGDASHR